MYFKPTQFQCILQLCGLHLQYGYLIQFGNFYPLLLLPTLLLLTILLTFSSFCLDLLLYFSPFPASLRRGGEEEETREREARCVACDIQ